MLISTRTAIRLLIFPSALLFAAGLYADDTAAANQNDRWGQVEEDAAKARVESEARAKAEAEAVARREAEAWKQLDAEKTKSADTAQKKADTERKAIEARAERDLALEQARAETAAERARAEAAERARADAENAREMAEAEAERAKSEAAAERARAEAAGRARAKTEVAQEDSSNSYVREGSAKKKKEGNVLLWYIPNRLSDLMDVFTFEIGAGELGLDLQLTRYASFGAGVGMSYMLGWSVCNQHGIYQQQGWYADLLNRRYGDVRREKVCGAYTPFLRSDDGRVDIEKMSNAKAEDPYAIGIKACCYLNLKFQIHVTELADFIAGIFFIDIMDDDNPQINWVF